jgi:small subunit ribosomal protein S2
VIDTNKEAIAIKEAKKLNIPVIGVIDSNSDPDGIAFPIPGNDDAIRAIALYCDLISRSVLDGLQQEAISSGVDVGEAEDGPSDDVPVEEVPAEAVVAEAVVAEAAVADAPAEEAAVAEAAVAEAPAEEAVVAEAPVAEAATVEAAAEPVEKTEG